MKRPWPALACIGLALAGPARALTIEFDYRYDTRGFFTDLATGAPLQERRDLLQQAASFYSGFTDRLTAIAPQAGDSWQVTIPHPSLGGRPITLSNVEIAADTLRIYVGGSASAPGVLGMAHTGSNLTATGSAAFVEAVTTRGQGDTQGADATDYATWGGMIWFNAAHDWSFSVDATGPASGGGDGRPDFLTTAAHEIGHILGFGEADAWLAQIVDGHFTGAASTALHGGAVPVDRFSAHWAEGVASLVDGVPQETLMDPSTRPGLRERPTALDYAGFADIGWQVPAVPEPTAWWLLAAGLPVLAAARRRG